MGTALNPPWRGKVRTLPPRPLAPAGAEHWRMGRDLPRARPSANPRPAPGTRPSPTLPVRSEHGPLLVRRNTRPPAGLEAQAVRAPFCVQPYPGTLQGTEMKHIPLAAGLALGASLVAGSARAQVFSPPFQSPVPASDFGVYVSDIGSLAVEGIWRRPSRGGSDIGLRAGFADTGEGALMLGLETRSPVVLAGAPIGLAFTAAGQGIVGDGTSLLGGQVGFTAGQRLDAGGFRVTPFIHPRLAVVADLSDHDGVDGENEVDLDVRADIGANFDFASGVSLRLDFNLADGADWGLGLAWRP